MIRWFLLSLFLVATLQAQGKAKLSWDANIEPDLSHYSAYIKKGESSQWVLLPSKRNIQETTTEFWELEFGATYYWYVTATDSTGNESLPSEIVSLKIPDAPDTTPPATPKNPRVELIILLGFIGIVGIVLIILILSNKLTIKWKEK